jgi:hypothetical protein
MLDVIQRRSQTDTSLVDGEPWLQQARLFLFQLDAGLVPNNSPDGLSPTEPAAARWRLTDDEVTGLVQQADGLRRTLPPKLSSPSPSSQ